MSQLVWERMYRSIPRLQAETRLDAFNVAVLANPWVSADTRDRFLDDWQRQASPPRVSSLQRFKGWALRAAAAMLGR